MFLGQLEQRRLAAAPLGSHAGAGECHIDAAVGLSGGFANGLPNRCRAEIENTVSPQLSRSRASYAELADKRGEVREALGYKGFDGLHAQRANKGLSPDAMAASDKADGVEFLVQGGMEKGPIVVLQFPQFLLPSLSISCARARASLDITVPIGAPVAEAISR